MGQTHCGGLAYSVELLHHDMGDLSTLFKHITAVAATKDTLSLSVASQLTHTQSLLQLSI